MNKRNPLAPKPRIPGEYVVIFVLATIAALLLTKLSLGVILLSSALLVVLLAWFRPSVPGRNCRVQPVRNEGPQECSKFPAGPTLPPLPWRRSCGWWVDAAGRKIIPRGVNFAGSCKQPTNPPELSNSHAKSGNIRYTSHREVSFVGRPCPLEECKEHLSRMRTCGCSLVRLLVSWEALEHSGPLQYDEEFIAYIRSVCEIARDVGIFVWIDPHQDCWSRYTGGSGAPGWTLEVCGMQVSSALHTSKAANLHWEHEDPAKMRHLSWPENNRRLACATMYTVFFAGDTYCPGVEPYWDAKNPAPPELVGLSLQRVLQECHIRSFSHLASKLADLNNILGFEIMNEPSLGFIGNRDLSEHVRWPLPIEETPFDMMMLADKQIWNAGCLWRRAGVWDYVDGKPELKKKAYFAHTKPVGAFFPPFAKEWASRIRKVMSRAELLVNAPAFGEESEEVWPQQCLGELRDYAIVSVHKYDEILLDQRVFVPGFGVDLGNIFSAMYRSLWSNIRDPGFVPVFGPQAVVDALHRQMCAKRAAVDGAFGTRIPSSTWAVPAIVSETGISMDVQGLGGGGKWNPMVQNHALDPTMRCLDAGFWSFTLWNYSLENSNEWGENWNMENLSLYAPEGSSGIDWKQRPWVREPENTFKNLRALAAWVRPHVLLLAGDPVHQHFSISKKIYTLVWQSDPRYEGEAAIAVIFLPLLHFGSGFKVEASPGLDYTWYPKDQTFNVIEGDKIDASSPRQRAQAQAQAEFKLVITATNEVSIVEQEELEQLLEMSRTSRIERCLPDTF